MSYQLRKCCLYINIGKSQVAKSGNQERSAKGTEVKAVMGDSLHLFPSQGPTFYQQHLACLCGPCILASAHKEWGTLP